MTPEAAAKDALEEALLADVDADTVGVHYGPPPEDETRLLNLWIGGVEFDEEPSSIAGAGRAANTDSEFTVEVFCDAQELDDVSPAGAKKVSEAAWALLHQLRRSIRARVASGKHAASGDGLYVWWSHVTSGSSSPGPEPYVDGGWVETVVARVHFTARIRS